MPFQCFSRKIRAWQAELRQFFEEFLSIQPAHLFNRALRIAFE